MRVQLKENLLVVIAETESEEAEISSWAAAKDGHVLALSNQDGQAFRLTDLGPRAEACREPINVTSQSTDPQIQLISNFASTSFELDGQRYASVESFWQGLKFPDKFQRAQLALLEGHAARKAGEQAVESHTFEYGGRTIRRGTADHWDLMLAACRAKFDQQKEAREALLQTGSRPLVHKTRRDSRNIPGVIMAGIWMAIRDGWRGRDELSRGSEH
jgi:predicted NAD-dependent protein-ADP-ribosyltransferase YbiA (DUF1768 family)